MKGPLVLAVLAIVLAIVALVLAIALPGSQGPAGPAGPQGPAGSAGSSMIVAMGLVDKNGSIGEALNVTSVTWNSDQEQWEITLDGIDYLVWDYVTVVSCIGGTGPYASHGSVDGKLIVYVFDSDGNRIKEGFSFVVFDVNAS